MTDRVEIRPLRKDQDDEYIVFLDELGKDDPAVLGYHYPFYRDLIQEAARAEPFYLGAWHQENLVAVLPGFLKQAGFGSVYCSLPFFGPNAGLLYDRSHTGVDQHSAMINRVVEHLHSLPQPLSASIYTPFLNQDFSPYDRAFPTALVVNKFTQYTHIPSFHPDKDLRYDIRKAEAGGITVTRARSTERLGEFYAIYVQNCRDADIPIKPQNAVKHLFRTAATHDQVRIYFGMQDDRLIGGLIVLCSPKTISYYLPCALPEYRALQPGTLLIQHAMQEAREKGQVYWNWESSPTRDSGVYTFKKKWASSEADYRIYVQTFQPASRFKEIGAASLQEAYPYFYIYPFSSL